MRGEMLWFNTIKQYGFIQTEDGERLYVHESGFSSGEIPEGRCAGKSVAFQRMVDGYGTRAVEVAFVEATVPRRARLRHTRGGSSL
jgi:cold shock CspA family protein